MQQQQSRVLSYILCKVLKPDSLQLTFTNRVKARRNGHVRVLLL